MQAAHYLGSELTTWAQQLWKLAGASILPAAEQCFDIAVLSAVASLPTDAAACVLEQHPAVTCKELTAAQKVQRCPEAAHAAALRSCLVYTEGAHCLCVALPSCDPAPTADDQEQHRQGALLAIAAIDQALQPLPAPLQLSLFLRQEHLHEHAGEPSPASKAIELAADVTALSFDAVYNDSSSGWQDLASDCQKITGLLQRTTALRALQLSLHAMQLRDQGQHVAQEPLARLLLAAAALPLQHLTISGSNTWEHACDMIELAPRAADSAKQDASNLNDAQQALATAGGSNSMLFRVQGVVESSENESAGDDSAEYDVSSEDGSTVIVTDHFFETLAERTSLTRLELSTECEELLVSVHHIRHAPLQELAIPRNDTTCAVFEDGEPTFAHFNTVTRLEVWSGNSDIDDADLSHLITFKQLRHLSLIGASVGVCPPYAGPSLGVVLHRMQELVHLDLGASFCSHAALAAVTEQLQGKALTFLNLSDVLTDELELVYDLDEMLASDDSGDAAEAGVQQLHEPAHAALFDAFFPPMPEVRAGLRRAVAAAKAIASHIGTMRSLQVLQLHDNLMQLAQGCVAPELGTLPDLVHFGAVSEGSDVAHVQRTADVLLCLTSLTRLDLKAMPLGEYAQPQSSADGARMLAAAIKGMTGLQRVSIGGWARCRGAIAELAPALAQLPAVKHLALEGCGTQGDAAQMACLAQHVSALTALTCLRLADSYRDTQGTQEGQQLMAAVEAAVGMPAQAVLAPLSEGAYSEYCSWRGL